MENKKKKYERPIVEIVEFNKDDIIATSGERLFDDEGNDNQERWW